MNKEQLNIKLEELKKEMVKINTQLSSHTSLENPGRVKLIKKTIAKIHTISTQKKKSTKEKTPTEKKEKISETKKTIQIKKIAKKIQAKEIIKKTTGGKTKKT